MWEFQVNDKKRLGNIPFFNCDFNYVQLNLFYIKIILYFILIKYYNNYFINL
jgi:hypothetical protein